jgi:hypothetical protein
MKNLTLGGSVKSLVAMEAVERKILLMRGQKVILDVDLAELYGVTTKVFNQAVKRNIDRFPPDFMFQLTEDEAERLRSQIVTAKPGRGGRSQRERSALSHGSARQCIERSGSGKDAADFHTYRNDVHRKLDFSMHVECKRVS